LGINTRWYLHSHWHGLDFSNLSFYGSPNPLRPSSENYYIEKPPAFSGRMSKNKFFTAPTAESGQKTRKNALHGRTFSILTGRAGGLILFCLKLFEIISKPLA
jgi:hypothetical protein